MIGYYNHNSSNTNDDNKPWPNTLDNVSTFNFGH